MQNNSFIKIHRISFVCCTHCLPGTSTQRGQAGTRIPWMCAVKWVKWWLSRSPPGPRKAKLHVQSSLVFSRFNLKHKQRPNPSKKKQKNPKGMFIKQAMRTKTEKHLQSTIGLHQNGISLKGSTKFWELTNFCFTFWHLEKETTKDSLIIRQDEKEKKKKKHLRWYKASDCTSHSLVSKQPDRSFCVVTQ